MYRYRYTNNIRIFNKLSRLCTTSIKFFSRFLIIFMCGDGHQTLNDFHKSKTRYKKKTTLCLKRKSSDADIYLWVD